MRDGTEDRVAQGPGPPLERKARPCLAMIVPQVPEIPQQARPSLGPTWSLLHRDPCHL